MTLSDLINALEELRELHGEDVEVRLAQQPSWPFEYGLSEIVALDMHADEREEIDEFLGEAVEDTDDVVEARLRLAELDAQSRVVVYLGEGSQIGYLPGAVASALGWR